MLFLSTSKLTILYRFTTRVIVLTISCLILSTHTFSQSEQEKQSLSTSKGIPTLYKEITGYVTSFGKYIEDVNINVKNTNRGTKTDDKGFYSVKAGKGEILVFTYVGMRKVEIIIEDITSVLNIELTPIVNKLKEVTVKSKIKRKDDIGPMKKPNVLTTSFGEINTEKVGYSVGYVKGEDLNLAAVDIISALLGKISNFRVAKDENGIPKVILRSTNSINLNNFAIWDIDGVIYTDPPPIDLPNVKDVTILRSLAGTVKYGAQGAGGVIVVRTKSAFFNTVKNSFKKDDFTNKEYYKGDAVTFNENEITKPYYLKVLDTIFNARQAYFTYQKILPSYKNQIEFHLDMASYFQRVYKDDKRSLLILSEIETQFTKNPEALKALAYTYQEQGLQQKALEVYKQIAKLRPNYAQSFRDLANAYVENNQYNNAWKLYMNYLYRGNALDEKGIGKIMYREMESLYTQKKELFNTREKFVVNDSLSLTNDVRFVFEWNTSEAEFDLEFVNPDKQVYTFEHTLTSNNALITNEKVKGYSSKEFVIENIGVGNWLVNCTYYGNKKYTPTYLKMTIYYNWNKNNQYQEIKLFKLNQKNIKVQLLKTNNSYLSN